MKKNSNLMLDGMMTIGKSENGMRRANFKTYDDAAHVEEFKGTCDVEIHHDGCVYLSERKAKADKPRSQAICLHKTAHGRASATADNAIQVTLKVYKREGLNPAVVVANEAPDMVAALNKIFMH